MLKKQNNAHIESTAKRKRHEQNVKKKINEIRNLTHANTARAPTAQNPSKQQQKRSKKTYIILNDKIKILSVCIETKTRACR